MTLTTLFLISSTLYAFAWLFLAVRLQTVRYILLCLTTFVFLAFNFFYHQHMLGYPTPEDILDKEVRVLYAVEDKTHIYYWILDKDEKEPRAHKFVRNSEEEKAFKEAQKLLQQGSKLILMKRDKEFGSRGGVKVYEFDYQERSPKTPED